ncbi:MAG: DUF4340 domain-containing protein [Rectinemataceae bacterium]
MMRYERKVLVLSGTLAALLAIWVLGMIFSPGRVEARSETGGIFAGKTDNAAAIELGGSESVSLVKQSDSWFLADASSRFPAQSDRIADFLKALADVKRLRPLAHSKTAWTGLGLDEGKAKSILVKNAAGFDMADLSVGNYGPTGSEIYIRKKGSDEAYAVSASFAAYLGYGRKSWLDLRIMPEMPESDVQSVSVDVSLPVDGPRMPALKIDYRLTRSGQGWSGPAGGVEASSADAMVRSIIALEAEDYVASPPADAFEPVGARVQLYLGAGGTRVLEIGRAIPPAPGVSAAGPTENRFYARLTGSPYTFEISSYSLRAALKTPAQLLPKK